MDEKMTKRFNQVPVMCSQAWNTDFKEFLNNETDLEHGRDFSFVIVSIMKIIS